MKEPRCEDCHFYHKYEDRRYYKDEEGWKYGCVDDESYCCTMFVETEKKREHQVVVRVKSDNKCEMFQEI